MSRGTTPSALPTEGAARPLGSRRARKARVGAESRREQGDDSVGFANGGGGTPPGIETSAQSARRRGVAP